MMQQLYIALPDAVSSLLLQLLPVTCSYRLTNLSCAAHVSPLVRMRCAMMT